MLPIPVVVKPEESTYSYTGFNKGIFSDSPRRFGKMTTNELAGCFQPNEFTYVKKKFLSTHICA
jgi:hypothetical protein